MNERNEYMDRTKGIGILAVILAHIGVGEFGTFLYTFHLPLFFIITGFFSIFKMVLCQEKVQIKCGNFLNIALV